MSFFRRLFCGGRLFHVFHSPLSGEISPACVVMNAAAWDNDSLCTAKATVHRFTVYESIFVAMDGFTHDTVP